MHRRPSRPRAHAGLRAACYPGPQPPFPPPPRGPSSSAQEEPVRGELGATEHGYPCSDCMCSDHCLMASPPTTPQMLSQSKGTTCRGCPRRAALLLPPPCSLGSPRFHDAPSYHVASSLQQVLCFGPQTLSRAGNSGIVGSTYDVPGRLQVLYSVPLPPQKAGGCAPISQFRQVKWLV